MIRYLKKILILTGLLFLAVLLIFIANVFLSEPLDEFIIVRVLRVVFVIVGGVVCATFVFNFCKELFKIFFVYKLYKNKDNNYFLIIREHVIWDHEIDEKIKKYVVLEEHGLESVINEKLLNDCERLHLLKWLFVCKLVKNIIIREYD
ncbi:hypothetical protein L8W41_07030 [Campylobacter sp. IFREMER_LSEM_CL1904]|uniref:hypothetical protein n=1 Tax=Campylobacter sp. IFREMER_LSEM_CL1904 TaxID=2911616 RepID=UPI0021E6ACEF|nr:hypothetical protein [Campylobacter sp. IFREMER_LSEM_CL1904]MCV3428479.1 hypothetical protein [Campylobacter sp. IFREMER_LSEM_CL1904]